MKGRIKDHGSATYKKGQIVDLVRVHGRQEYTIVSEDGHILREDQVEIFYTAHDALAAHCALEPMVCLHCGSFDEVTWHQYQSNGYCGNCGCWQLGED